MAELIVSSDSHVSEPPDLWLRYIEPSFRDRAPRIERVAGMGDMFKYEGKANPVGLGIMAGKKPEEYKSVGATYDDARKGGWDPDERLKDMDLDGVQVDVMYPTLGMALFTADDVAFKHACFRAYNDWIADFVKRDPKRLVGIALIGTDDLDEAVHETKRTRDLGLKGILLRAIAPEDKPYSNPVYDTLWAVAQDLDIPVSLHIGGGDKPTLDASRPGCAETYITMAPFSMQSIVATLIYSGVLERFPRLRIVSVESGIGWLAALIERMDHVYQKHRFWTKSSAKRPPSEYMRRQVYATFQEDVAGIATRHLAGVDNLMWASDYPHSDTTWPESKRVITETFAGVPADEKAKIVGGNAAQLYRLS